MGVQTVGVQICFIWDLQNEMQTSRNVGILPHVELRHEFWTTAILDFSMSRFFQNFKKPSKIIKSKNEKQ